MRGNTWEFITKTLILRGASGREYHSRRSHCVPVHCYAIPPPEFEGRATYNTCLVGTVVVACPPQPGPRARLGPFPPIPAPESQPILSPFPPSSPTAIDRDEEGELEIPRESDSHGNTISTGYERTTGIPLNLGCRPLRSARHSFAPACSASQAPSPRLILLDCQGSRRQLQGRHRPAPSLHSLVFPSLVTPRRPYRRRRHSYLVFGFLFPTHRSLSKRSLTSHTILDAISYSAFVSYVRAVCYRPRR